MDAPVVDADYLMEIEKARRDLHALIFMDNRRAPLMLRLAWYDAATYDANTKTGGPNGSVRYYTEELKLDANKGLKSAVDLCVDIKTKLKKITYADLYQLAGIVAVEATGGPTIDFVSGRKDSLESPTKGRLPDPATRGAGYLRDVCNRMGLSDKDFVALSGSITWAYEEDKSKSESQPRTTYPLKFDYSYFPKLLKGDDSKGLLKLPMDKFLVEDPKFRRHVELYSNDEDAFFRDYAAAHKKFSELGLKRRTHDQCLWEELLLLGCCFE